MRSRFYSIPSTQEDIPLREKFIPGFSGVFLPWRENPSVSQTKFIEYGEQGFWAYDVAQNIFLKHLIDAAEASDQAQTDWLSDAISDWRVSCVPDYGLTLETSWTSAQKQTFVDLASDACARLATRESIPAGEIAFWPILDDLRLDPRGTTAVFTAPIVELGHAIIALVLGELPNAPEGETWLYGTPEGRQTIGWKR